MKWKAWILRSIPQVRFNHVWSILFVTDAFLRTQTAEVAPYMLDKNTPRRNVLSVLTFCASSFSFFPVRRVVLFFSIFISLQSRRLQIEKRYRYRARSRTLYFLCVSVVCNRNRFIRTGKENALELINVEVLLSVFI